MKLGHLGGSVVGHWPLAQVLIPVSWDWVLHQAPHGQPASPSAYVSASLSVSLMNKYTKSFKKKDLERNEVMTHATKWIKLENIRSGISQTQKDEYHMTWINTVYRKATYVETENRIVATDTESLSTMVKKEFWRWFMVQKGVFIIAWGWNPWAGRVALWSWGVVDYTGFAILWKWRWLRALGNSL